MTHETHSLSSRTDGARSRQLLTAFELQCLIWSSKPYEEESPTQQFYMMEN